MLAQSQRLTQEWYCLDGVEYQKDEYDAKTRPLLAGDRTAHITVSYKDSGDEFTRIYAVNEEISRELRQETQKPTGKALRTWLENKGCQLDSSDGPAYVWRYASGSTSEHYYTDGKLHREAGPATIWRSADGTTSEQYFLDGVEYQKNEYDAKTHPLLTGLRVPLANGGQDTIETLLREAMAEQSAPHTLAAGRPLSLSLRSSAPGAQPGAREREWIPLPHL